MYKDFSGMSDFYFGDGLKEPKQRNNRSDVSTSTNNNWTRRHRRIEQITDQCRRENEKLRKPCPCCGTLVKPELLSQHYDAYHPAVCQ